MTAKKSVAPKSSGRKAAAGSEANDEPTRKKADAPRKGGLLALYAARRFLDGSVQESMGLKISFNVYFQDPSFAKNNPELPEFDKLFVGWEPGLSDGPTSARFAVVDYNGDAGALVPPAKWDEDTRQFVDTEESIIDQSSFSKGGKSALQAHQVHVWAVLQRALDFFESGFGLGRRISWGFEGNRLRRRS
jgi:hypothetical protein